jgi:hypothetical protein
MEKLKNLVKKVIFQFCFFIMFGCNSDNKLDSLNLQLIDSVNLNNSGKNIFWYRNDLGLQGYSICKLSLSKSIDSIFEDDIFLISDYITNVELNGNQIVVELYGDSYSLIKSNVDRFSIKISLDGDIRNSHRFRLDSTLVKPTW